MGYYNPIYIYGVDAFLADAKAAGVDGLIVVDLPPEEDEELCIPALKAGLNFIRLTTPTTDDRRLPAVLEEHLGLRLLRLDDRHHRRGDQESHAAVGEAVKRIKGHTEPAGRGRLRHQDRRRRGEPWPRCRRRRRRHRACNAIGQSLADDGKATATTVHALRATW